MIIEVTENLLEYPLDGFIHQANCFQTMGSGIAYSIKKKYPELFQADLNHGRSGDNSRLGKFSTVKCHDDKQGYNLYGQYNYGCHKRQTNYEAVYSGLSLIKEHAMNNNILKLGLPKRMGCVLGGGSWAVVEAIIKDIFENYTNDLYICDYNK